MASHTTTELRTLFHQSYDEIRHHGDKSTPPRSLQCASAVNDMLGMAVAYAIADPHFYNFTKPKVRQKKQTEKGDTYPFVHFYHFLQVVRTVTITTQVNVTVVMHFISDTRYAMGNEKGSYTSCQQSEMDG